MGHQTYSQDAVVPDFTFKSHVRVKCGKSARGLLFFAAHLSLCLETPSELFEDHHDCFNIFKMLKVPDYYCHVIFSV